MAVGEQDGAMPLDRSFVELKLNALDADNASTDTCPVCKSSRYLNKSMRFLVNPECYHKMCESCVDRIFSHGPNRCPIAGCPRTLRRHRFREQTFGDIRIEREVDIRKRIAAIYNLTEKDFESLRHYNDYLNDVEDITFNLIEGIDLEETEAKMRDYQTNNSKTISEKAAAARRDADDFSAMQLAEREKSKLAQQAARRNDEDERRARVEGRNNIIDKLASAAGNAERIAEEGQRISAKRRKDVRETAARTESLLPNMRPGLVDVSGSSMGFKGLRAPASASTADRPFDPFDGFALHHNYYVLQSDYAWEWLDNAKTDPIIVAGGYRSAEFNSRALCDAFGGLGVFVGGDTITPPTVVGGDAVMADSL